MESGTGLLDTPLWLRVWEQKGWEIAALGLFLLLLLLGMLLKDGLARRRRLLAAVRYGVLAVSFACVGLVLKAQPTTTNIVIMLNSMRELQFPLGLFLLEPFIFLSFVFIFLTLLLWGRGVFCGWLCPYGALLELLNRAYARLFPKGRVEPPEKVHSRLIYLKYVLLAGIVGVSFYNFILSEYLTEVEPFRTLVLKLHREWYFVLYFVLLTAGSLVVYRGFCRYVCPLGAALAVPSFLRWFPWIRMRRYDFCARCSICRRDCTPRAIGPSGRIDARECLTCLDCQVNYWDRAVCPVLKKGAKP